MNGHPLRNTILRTTIQFLPFTLIVPYKECEQKMGNVKIESCVFALTLRLTLTFVYISLN